MSEKITVQDLMESGVHFGHQVKRWNPKMKDYVYGVRNGIHIIDLTKTMHSLADACNFLQHTVMDGGNILFVGTKRQAQAIVKEEAEAVGMFHMAERWLGGTLTNYATIRKSINKMRSIDKSLEKGLSGMTKREAASLKRTSGKLHKSLDGISSMKKLPAALFVIDIRNEHIAIKEAKKLGIPVVAVVDTNTNPEDIDYPIPGNDDAIRSIKVLTKVVASSIGVAAEIYKVKAEEEAAVKAKKREEEAAARASKKKAAPKHRRPAPKKAAEAKPVEAKKEEPKAETAK